MIISKFMKYKCTSSSTIDHCSTHTELSVSMSHVNSPCFFFSSFLFICVFWLTFFRVELLMVFGLSLWKFLFFLILFVYLQANFTMYLRLNSTYQMVFLSTKIFLKSRSILRHFGIHFTWRLILTQSFDRFNRLNIKWIKLDFILGVSGLVDVNWFITKGITPLS